MNISQKNMESELSFDKIVQNRKALEVCVMPKIDHILASNPRAHELASRFIVY